ncbi:MAG: hypothetical protein M1834_003701 [Cirrosporium novae-zelandiae]|nr:MAG: hypothetical protein M1834_003701 [Cirrosporium novae-zelandiae]
MSHQQSELKKPEEWTFEDKDIRPFFRHITTHSPDGQAIFSDAIPAPAPAQTLPDGAQFCLLYATNTFPVDFSKDVPDYANYLEKPPGVTISTGSVCRVVDMRPGALSPMHRTVSLDYGVVIEGEVEIVLDSGETRKLSRGDVVIQRGTMHAWRNLSPDKWARMLYVLVPAEKIIAGEKELGEDTGTIPGIRASD